MIEAILIYGAITSGILALLAVGYTLIYGVAEITNMAHGALFMFGTYIFWFLTAPPPSGTIEMHIIPAFIIAAISAAIVGSIIYRIAIHPVVEDVLAVLIITIGVSMMSQGLTAIQFGSARRSVVALAPGVENVFGVVVTYSRLLSFAVSLILFAALWIFVTKSKMGSAMRAVAQDREVAMLMGINTERLYMLTMGIASAMAAVAGIVTTAEGFAEPYMWSTPLYMSFAIVILGGIGSIKGTLIGAFIVGYASETFVRLAPEVGFLRGAVALGVMVLVIILRPKGLFGRRIEME